jgi:peptide chain release factor 2
VPPNSGGFFDYDHKKDRLEEVARLAEDPNFWNDAEKAQELGRERKSLEDVVLVLDRVASGLKDAAELFEMAREENDDDTLAAVQADIAGLEKDVSTLEFRRMFNNPADPNNCFIDIQAGAGGTEAQDWAGMLLRACICATPSARASRPRCWKNPKAKSPASRVPRSRSMATTPTAPCAPKPASTAWCARARSTPTRPPHQLRQRVRLSGSRRFDRDRDQSGRPARRHLSRVRRRRPAHQQDRLRGAHHPPAQRHRRAVPERPLAAQEPRRSDVDAEGPLYEAELRKRQAEQQVLEDRQERRRLGPPDPLLRAGQSRIKDLRTNVEVGNTQAVLDGDLDDFIEASLKQGV